MGERVPVSADIFPDGHDLLGGRVRWRRGDRKVAIGAARVRASTTGGSRIDRTGRHRAARARGRGVARPVCHLAPRHRDQGGGGAGRRARAGGGRPHPRGAGRRVSGAEARSAWRRRPRAAPGAARSRFGSTPASTTRSPSWWPVSPTPADHVGAASAVGRPPARRPRGLVRAVPAQLGRAEGRHRAPALRRRPGLRRRVPAADPPHRRHRPQGPGQHPRRRPRRSRQPLGHRLADGGHTAIAPRARHPRGLRRLHRRGRGPRTRGRARLRAPVLPRPPLGPRASRVVPAPARWLDPLRREPAEEVPGHLPHQLLARRRRRPRRAVGGVPRRARVLDRPGRPRVPGRQPAHQADGVLGLDDRRRARP